MQTADHQVFWRLRAEQAGDHVLAVKVGDEVFEKGWAVGGDARKIPLKRLRGFEAILYPGEAALPVRRPRCSRWSSAMHIRARSGPSPPASSASSSWVLILSLVAGFAVKGVFGVTI